MDLPKLGAGAAPRTAHGAMCAWRGDLLRPRDFGAFVGLGFGVQGLGFGVWVFLGAGVLVGSRSLASMWQGRICLHRGDSRGF